MTRILWSTSSRKQKRVKKDSYIYITREVLSYLYISLSTPRTSNETSWGWEKSSAGPCFPSIARSPWLGRFHAKSLAVVLIIFANLRWITRPQNNLTKFRTPGEKIYIHTHSLKYAVWLVYNSNCPIMILKIICRIMQTSFVLVHATHGQEEDESARREFTRPARP